MRFFRELLAIVALFVFIFLFELYVHGYLLINMYEATPNVWRDFAVMKENIHVEMFFKLCIAVWLVFAFSQLYKEGGIGNGFRFGVFFGIFAGLLTMSWVLWLPVPEILGVYWLFSSIVEGIIGGLIVGAIYRVPQ